MATKTFISDEEMQALEATSTPDFISDDEMIKLEAPSTPQTPSENIDKSGKSIGELRRRDEAVIQVGNLNDPTAQQNIEAGQRMLAFARPFADTAIPGAGAPARMVETRAIQSEFASQGKPISLQEAQAMANQRQLAREEAFPAASLLGLGAGLVTSGALTGPVGSTGRALGGRLGLKTTEEAGEILALAGIGGLENAMFNADTEDAQSFNDFIGGAALTGAITGMLKLPQLGKAGLKDISKANDFLVAAQRKNVQESVDMLQKEANVLTEKVAQSGRLQDKVANNLAAAETQLEILANSRRQAEQVMKDTANSPIKVAQLPESIDQDFGVFLNDVGQLKQQRLEQVGSRIHRVDKPYERTMSSLLKGKNFTGPAEAARQDAIKAMAAFEEGIDVQDLVQEADPLLGKKASSSRVRRGSALELDKAKQQLQDLLYNKEWLKTAPRDIRNSMVSFEKSIRNIVNSSDPTGELAIFNNAFHGGKKAQLDAQDLIDRSLFEKVSKGDLDLPVVQDKMERLFDSLDSAENLTARKALTKSGFDNRTLNHPLIRDKVLNFKGQLRSRIDDATGSYGSYKEAKRLNEQLFKEEDRLNKSISNYTTRLDSLGVGQQARELASQRKQGKILELQQKAADMNAIEFLPFGMDKLGKFFTNKPIKEAAVKKAGLLERAGKKIPKPIKKAGSLAARGASFQTPELFFDVPDNEDVE